MNINDILIHPKPDYGNMPEPHNTMGDDEFSVQMFKIFLGIVGLVLLGYGLLNFHHNIITIIQQQGEIIKLLQK